MKAKIILLGNELIISSNFKKFYELHNLKLHIRCESEEAVNEISRNNPDKVLIADINLDDYKEHPAFLNGNSLSRLINSNGAANQYHLSQREKEILSLLIEGLTKRRIAEKLSLSFHTIDSHLRNIYKSCVLNPAHRQ